jgi:hypothetical protein
MSCPIAAECAAVRAWGLAEAEVVAALYAFVAHGAPALLAVLTSEAPPAELAAPLERLRAADVHARNEHAALGHLALPTQAYPYEPWHCWKAGVVFQERTPAEWLAWVEAQQEGGQRR